MEKRLPSLLGYLDYFYLNVQFPEYLDYTYYWQKEYKN